MSRERRGLLRKFFYKSCWRCASCGERLTVLRPSICSLGVMFSFLFSLHSCCPSCGNEDVERLPERDSIDAMTRNPLGLFQAILGAPLKHCWRCRLQYYDWRPVPRMLPSRGAATGRKTSA